MIKIYHKNKHQHLWNFLKTTNQLRTQLQTTKVKFPESFSKRIFQPEPGGSPWTHRLRKRLRLSISCRVRGSVTFLGPLRCSGVGGSETRPRFSRWFTFRGSGLSWIRDWSLSTVSSSWSAMAAAAAAAGGTLSPGNGFRIRAEQSDAAGEEFRCFDPLQLKTPSRNKNSDTTKQLFI